MASLTHLDAVESGLVKRLRAAAGEVAAYYDAGPLPDPADWSREPLPSAKLNQILTYVTVIGEAVAAMVADLAAADTDAGAAMAPSTAKKKVA
jgi:hypothetical protein